MLEVIAIAALVTAATLIVCNLLGNDEIFDGQVDFETAQGTGYALPYERIEALSCDTEVQFTEKDSMMAMGAVEEICNLLGNDPVERICQMKAEDRINAVKALHERLCRRFSLDIELVMGKSDDGLCGYYAHGRKMLWTEYRYLISEEKTYIREYLDTIVHEFRHAMQWHFIENGTYNDATDDYRKRMTINMLSNVYMKPEENPELYYKQLCERDARAFAGMVLQQLEGGE